MTMVMPKHKTVSKSELKARALEYFREVERTGQELVVTDRGRPVLKVVPYRPEEDLPSTLRDTVLRYDEPTEPVAEEDWESLP